MYLANYEQLPWLSKQIQLHFISPRQPLPFDFLVLDEIDRLKNARITQGTKAYQHLRTFLYHMKFRTGGTGTPGTKGYKNLFGQYLALDDGQRLGTGYTTFSDKWFRNRSRDARYEVLEPLSGAKEEIIERIKDITFEMQPEEKAKLPDYQYHDLWVDLPPKRQQQYDILEKRLFTLLDSGARISAPNILARRNYLRQVANGAVYINKRSKEWELVHDEKLNMLKQLVAHLQGQPLLLSYMYAHDWQRIEKAFKGRTIVRIDGTLSARQLKEVNAAWNRGEIEIMAGHETSIGHGLNFQRGGHNICWFGCDERTSNFLQFNARLRRRNQQSDSVNVYRILTRNTVDEAIVDTIRRDVLGENKMRNTLLASLDDYRRRKESSLCRKTA